MSPTRYGRLAVYFLPQLLQFWKLAVLEQSRMVRVKFQTSGTCFQVFFRSLMWVMMPHGKPVLGVQWASPKSGRHGVWWPSQSQTSLLWMHMGGLCCFCEKSFLGVEWNSTRWSVLWFLLPLTLCDPCLPFPFFGFFQVWCLEKTLGPLGSGSLCSPGSQSCWGSKESEGDWCEQWGRSLAMPVLSREGQPESLYFWCVYFL